MDYKVYMVALNLFCVSLNTPMDWSSAVEGARDAAISPAVIERVAAVTRPGQANTAEMMELYRIARYEGDSLLSDPEKADAFVNKAMALGLL